MNWEAQDSELLREIDRELATRSRIAGEHLVCRIGCTECCIGPFSINRLDVLRIRRGLSLLFREDPDRAAAIVERARDQVALMQPECPGPECPGPEYPGDPLTGALSPEDAFVEAFFERFSALPCPVLDPASGRCELYSTRPLSCRTFGLPVHIGGEDLEPCRLCFSGATPKQIEASRACPDPAGREQRLLVQLEGGDYNEETIIAFAVGTEDLTSK